jgi:hypothetical protein
LKSISPKSDLIKIDAFGVKKGTKRSTGPNVNLLGPKKEKNPPKHVLPHSHVKKYIRGPK